MKKPLKITLFRSLIPLCFIVLTIVGTIWHLGWGTLSSFGWKEISAICPLGALEIMFAEKSILPRAVIALGIFFILAVLFGRFFCGWLCPVPSVSALLQFVKNGGRYQKIEKERDVAPTSADGLGHFGKSSKNFQRTPSNACNSSFFRCTDCQTAKTIKCNAIQRVEKNNAGPLTVLVGALASSAVFGFPVFCLICPVGLTFALVIALSRLFQFNESGWSVVIFATFLILELLVLRRWCHNFCPLGALIGLMSRLNRTFVPRINPKACVHSSHGVDCKICLDACPEGIDLRNGPLQSSQTALCIKCGACAQACPSKAVNFPWLKSSPFRETKPIPERGSVEIESVQDRVQNYGEVRRSLTLEQAVEQSARCLRCGRCMEACPQGNQISQWMALLNKGDIEAAAQLMLREGAMPEVCGRICPSERFCERMCSMQDASGAVMIADIERAVSQYVLDHGYKPKIRRARLPIKVAVIGAGPAGLACADYLARRGVHVAVYDKQKEIGGLLTYGIPPFKLPRSVVGKRRLILQELGVKLNLGITVGKDINIETLRANNDVIFVATGAGAANDLTVSGSDLKGVMPAMHLLEAIGCRASGEIVELPEVAGKRIVVLGGGDTAVDCLRCALREGASEVVAVARKPKNQLRATPSELTLALQEGARIFCDCEVKRIVGNEGIVQGVLCVDAKGQEFEIPADIVFVAYGFKVGANPELLKIGVTFDEEGRICVNEDNATALKGVYAGGDAVRGSYLVTAAIADGRTAAQAILKQYSLD